MSLQTSGNTRCSNALLTIFNLYNSISSILVIFITIIFDQFSLKDVQKKILNIIFFKYFEKSIFEKS